MAVPNQDEAFYTNLLKAYKMEYANARTPVEKQQAGQKADQLRANAKLMGIQLDDAVWGQNVPLASTPGGTTIDWNLLSTVGKAWAATNPVDDVTRWKQSVGLGLTTNLAGYQADYATAAESTAYGTVGAKATPVTPQPTAVGISGMVAPVMTTSNVGQPVTPAAAVAPPVATPAPAPVVQQPPPASRTAQGLGQMAASQATALQAARPVKPTEANTPGYEWTQENMNSPWVQTPILTKAGLDANANLSYDPTMLAAFLKDNAGVEPNPANWDTPMESRFATWVTNYIAQASAAAIVDGGTYDATKEPWWSAYVDTLQAGDALTKASLKTALDLKTNATNLEMATDKAAYSFQVAEIDNALNMANWSSREEMAQGNVFMSGALMSAIQANEAQGLIQKGYAGQVYNANISKLARDITILTSDYANQGTLIDAKTIADIGLKRLEFLTGNTQEVQDGKALLATLKLQGAALNIAAPGTMKAAEAGITATEATATYEDAKWWLTTSVDALAKGITVVRNSDGSVTLSQVLSPDKIATIEAANPGMTVDATGHVTGTKTIDAAQIATWMAEGLYYDPKTGILTQQLTPAQAETQRHNIALEKIQKDGVNVSTLTQGETTRHNKAMEGIAQQNANTAAVGGAAGAVYDPTNDRALVNSANFIPSGPGSLPFLRLGAYSGAMTGTDAALKDFFYGGTTVVTPAVTDAKGKVTTPEVTQAYTGLNALNETDAAAVILLIADDVRAGEAWAMYCGAHNLGTVTATFNEYAAQNNLTPAQIASGLGFLSQTRGGQP
jgi:hypothetical protein